MFYKVVSGLVAIPAGAYLQEAKPLPSHNHLATYTQQQARTQYYQYSYFPRTIPEWNRLPEAIAMAPSLDTTMVSVAALLDTNQVYPLTQLTN